MMRGNPAQQVNLRLLTVRTSSVVCLAESIFNISSPSSDHIPLTLRSPLPSSSS